MARYVPSTRGESDPSIATGYMSLTAPPGRPEINVRPSETSDAGMRGGPPRAGSRVVYTKRDGNMMQEQAL